MKYILYARKSTEDNKRQVLSLDSQVDAMKKLAKDLNLKIVKEFREEKSAKEPNNRPMFSEMIKMLERGEADAILCWHINRLSRNPIDSGILQWHLQKEIIKEIQTHEKKFLPTDNVIVLNVESGMANQSIRELSSGVKRGIEKKLRNGDYPNNAKIGYLNDKLNKKIIVDPERFGYIKKAFEMYGSGSYSLKQVANTLYDEGFRSRKGNKYHKDKVRKVLQDPFYYGVMFVQGVFYNANHKPLVSKDLFNKVQDIIAGKNRSRYKKHFYPLRGFMTCNVCGCLLTTTKAKGFVYYYCTNSKGKCSEHKKYMRSEKAEEKLSSIFEKIQFDEKFIELCYKADKEKNKTDDSFYETAKANLENRLKTIAQNQSRLLDIQIAGNYNENTVTAKIAAFNKESVDVKQELTRLTKQSPETLLRTLEQTKKVFLTPYSSQKDFIEGDDFKKHDTLEKLLSNATFENQEMASYKLKQPYQILEKVTNKADFCELLTLNSWNLVVEELRRWEKLKQQTIT